jgi:hypothetical protein
MFKRVNQFWFVRGAYLETIFTVLVIDSPLVFVAQDFVCLPNLFEFFRRYLLFVSRVFICNPRNTMFTSVQHLGYISLANIPMFISCSESLLQDNKQFQSRSVGAESTVVSLITKVLSNDN